MQNSLQLVYYFYYMYLYTGRRPCLEGCLLKKLALRHLLCEGQPRDMLGQYKLRILHQRKECCIASEKQNEYSLETEWSKINEVRAMNKINIYLCNYISSFWIKTIFYISSNRGLTPPCFSDCYHHKRPYSNCHQNMMETKTI